VTSRVPLQVESSSKEAFGGVEVCDRKKAGVLQKFFFKTATQCAEIAPPSAAGQETARGKDGPDCWVAD